MTDPNTPQDNPADEPSLEDEWASAMAEQGDDAGLDDPWAEALAEQEAAPVDAPAPAASKMFRPLAGQGGGAVSRDLEMIMDIPVKLSVELGRTRVTIKQLLELAQGSVLALDGLAGEPMDILINGYLIAQGEVVVVDEKYGIRITEIITPSERVQKLNR
ncbi:flagellar motor switch protein FliN [Pseudomonas sp. App30]|uniref:flagellar motor switch protein FliN n=1 Tax=Pseudomonas sp. App30 TaxID=3068990 RepID=UPI003A804497